MAPMLNLNPAFTLLALDQVDVFRRQEAVNPFGESRMAEQVTLGVPAVVGPAGQNKLDRRPEAQSTEKVIEVICRFSLRMASPGYQADTVRWRGDDYTVVSVLDYSKYGAGFVQAMAEARPVLQTPPETR